jgi:hypothetical protein
MSALQAAIDALKAQYLTDSALLPDVETRLDVAMQIEQWYAVQGALAALQSERLQSYSMGGNSYTRRQIPELESSAAQLKQAISEALYGGRNRLVDNRFEVWV